MKGVNSFQDMFLNEHHQQGTNDDENALLFETEDLEYPELFGSVESEYDFVEGLKENGSIETIQGTITLQQKEFIATLLESNFCKWLALEKCGFDISQLEDALTEYSKTERALLNPEADDMALKIMAYFRNSSGVSDLT